MFRWIFVTLLLSASAVVAVWLLVPYVQSSSTNPSSEVEPPQKQRPSPVVPRERAPLPQRPSPVSSASRGQPEVIRFHSDQAKVAAEPVIIPDCPLVIFDKQEVASEKEGVIVFIGTEVQMGENVPPEKQLPEAHLGFLALNVGDKPVEGETCFQIPNDPKNYYRRAKPTDQLDPKRVTLLQERLIVRKLQVGDLVKRGQLLAQVNPAKSNDEVAINIAKVDEVEAARFAAEQQRREYNRRILSYQDISRSTPGAIPRDTLEETRLQMVKADGEEKKAREELKGAQRKLNASATDMKFHEIRAAIDGIVKAIYKNHQGDAVKPLEAILRIENPTRLRVVGRLEVQEALKLEKGMKAIVEASRPESPKFVLNGHIGPVNCVAVSKGKRPIIVSGSDDESLWGWDSATGDKLWAIYPLHSAVKSVACSPPASKHNLACFGCSDGTVRLIDLNNPDKKNLREMSERHTGPVFGVAFSPNGEIIASCGDDKLIRLWKTETGELLTVRQGHAAPITSVHFASAKRLVTAGKDKRLNVWDVEDVSRFHPIGPRFDSRGGEVATLGVSPDGKTVLFDQGKELRLLTLESRQMVGTLQDFSAPMNFSTLAIFSPDGKTILTNRSMPGKLQLWRTPPVTQTRGSELRQFVWMKGAATCGAFAPEDRSFAVTGTQDNKVLVWAMPSEQEVDSRLEAELMLVEKYIDTQNRDVRVWAELKAPEWLIPGMRATMVVLPQKK